MNGILIVDKPQGMTSHDVVDFIRKSFALKKVGHAGTLDPMATGVLIILVGPSTKSAPSFINDDKEYEATMAVGATSDTGDAWGRVKVAGDPAQLTEASIVSAFKKFEGVIEQTPPPYSAVKFKGKKLYEFARKGITVQVEPRKVCIKKLEILRIMLPNISFRVTCSKGTYIRQLCADIGAHLGCGAYLSQLKRTRSGAFMLNQALTIDELKVIASADLEKRLIAEPVR